MDNFQKNEQDGRELFSSFLIQIEAQNVEFTKEKYNPVDVYFTYDNQKIVGEIKIRDKKYLDYDTHIMEVSKYNNLVQAKNENNCRYGYYINFFGDDIMYLYSLSTIYHNSTKTSLHCNRTTAVDTGKTDKAVLEIDAKSAQKFIRINGKWMKYQKYYYS